MVIFKSISYLAVRQTTPMPNQLFIANIAIVVADKFNCNNITKTNHRMNKIIF